MKPADQSVRWSGPGSRLALFALGGVLASGAAAAQTLGGAPRIEIPFVRIFAALIVCGLIALGAALVVKRHLGSGAGLSQLFTLRSGGALPKRIKVHETYRLSPHANVCRFSAANREYLVIISPTSTQVLSVTDEDESDGKPSSRGGALSEDIKPPGSTRS